MKKENKKLIIYQSKDGSTQLRSDAKNETIWATQKQMAEIFDVKIPTINEHIKNIHKTSELDKNATIRKFLIVQKEGKREVSRNIDHYNLDMIISVGYRVNSKTATKFRQWATKILKQYIDNVSIANNLFRQKKAEASQVIEDIKKLSVGNTQVKINDVLELIKSFSETWFSLQSYDEEGLPKDGFTKKDITIKADELYKDIEILKSELVQKKQASELFAQEKKSKNLEGILGNVFQSVFNKDAYDTIEEKAAHLLYFIVKNHPFNDGNKRTAAFPLFGFCKKQR